MFRRLSLKARLGLGAGLLGLATLLTAAMLVAGMARVSQRLDTALAAEQRLEHYAALSTQVDSLQQQLSDEEKANLKVSTDAVEELLEACKGLDSSLA